MASMSALVAAIVGSDLHGMRKTVVSCPALLQAKDPKASHLEPLGGMGTAFQQGRPCRLQPAMRTRPCRAQTSGTALHVAASLGAVPMVKELLAHGAPHEAVDKRENTALHVASELVGPPCSLHGGGGRDPRYRVGGWVGGWGWGG